MTPKTIHDRRWATLAVLSLSLLVIGLDNTILNVALPTLVRELGATSSELQWILDSYMLVFAGLLLTMGAIGDRFGRKAALNSGLIIFGVASVFAAFSDSANSLIVARAFMGIGAALIMPSTLSIITNVFSGKERGKAIGVWAAVAGLGAILGPAVGGWLLEHFWWGSVFLINIFVVAIAIATGFVLVPESKDEEATPLDLVGAGLSIIGLGGLVFAIIEAPARGWTDELVLICFSLALVMLTLMLIWEKRTTYPMLRLEFFRNPRFSAASATIVTISFGMLGSVFLLTQYLQFVLRFSPLEAGIRLLPMASLVVAAPVAANVVERVGTKKVVVTGMIFIAVALGWLAMATIDSGYGHVAISLLLLGAGLGVAGAPATDSIMGSLPLAKSGVGSAMNDSTRMVGASLGVAVLGSALASTYSSEMASVTGSLTAEQAALASDSIGGTLTVAVELASAGVESWAAAASLVAGANQAFVNAMSAAALIGTAVAIVGAIIAWRYLPALPLDPEERDRLYEDRKKTPTQS